MILRKNAIFPLAALAALMIPVARAATWERPWYSTAGALTAAAGVTLIPESTHGSPWKNPVDSLSRDLIRDRDPDGRMRARVYSDIGLTLSITAPIANTIFSGYQSETLRADRPDREWMAFTGAHALAANWILTETLKRLTARTRPRASFCEDTDLMSCASSSDRQTHKSFPSGHTSFAFTGAGLICLHASQVRTGTLFLSGEGWCPAALGVAALTGLLRVNADEHWLSDMIVGAAIGISSSLWIAPALAGAAPGGRATPPSLIAPAIPVLMFRY